MGSIAKAKNIAPKAAHIKRVKVLIGRDNNRSSLIGDWTKQLLQQIRRQAGFDLAQWFYSDISE